MSGSIDAVLIDLDGTLLDTVDDIAAAGNAMLAEAGLPPLTRQCVATLIGGGAQLFVTRALSAESIAPDAAIVARWLPVFMRHYEACNGRYAAIYPGVIDGLNALRGAGLKLACVTNKPRALTDAILALHRLSDYFDVVVGGGDTLLKKPDPQPLLHACELLNVAIDRVVMIGDSVNDAQAGRAAGCRTLLLPYGYNEGQPVTELDADGFIDSLRDAWPAIEAFAAR